MNCIRCFFSMFWGTCKTQRQWIQRSVSAVKVFKVFTILNQATTCLLKRALQHVVGPQYIYQGSAFLPVRTVSQLYFQDKECCEICENIKNVVRFARSSSSRTFLVAKQFNFSLLFSPKKFIANQCTEYKMHKKVVYMSVQNFAVN